MKKYFACVLALILVLSGCASKGEGETTTNPIAENYIEGTQIVLSDSGITVDGATASTDSTQAVYTANDIVFYLAGQDFTYGEGTEADGHEQSEADKHTVVHITKPGTYVLSGKLSAGQIAVDLGEDAENDSKAVVTLVLNNVDITCTVAPGIIFYNVYECCFADEETATKDVDTSKAGANILIADNSTNTVNGSYVAKIYKSYELNEDGTEIVDSKKLHKYDGAVYSKKTMNINGQTAGNGILNINAENEGLDSELHLTINGGVININSGNDGINTNEDYVSVTTINGGTLNITVNGSTGEGDGIDSNGWLVINGGNVNAYACSKSGDAGIDSDMGIYINGGSVCATGNMLDRIAGGSQTYIVLQFAESQKAKTAYSLKNSSGDIVATYIPENDFIYLLVAGSYIKEGDYTLHSNLGQYEGVVDLAGFDMGGMPEGEMPQRPDGETPQMPEGEMPQKPEGERPQMPEGEVPQMPEGEVPQMPQGGMVGGPGQGSFGAIGETTSVFAISSGGITISNVRLMTKE